MPRVTTYFTQAEVCKRLDVADPKTLKAWCSETSPPIQPRKRRTFGNVQWYTEHELRQLEKIAEQHGRRVRKLEDHGEGEKGLPSGEDRQDGEESQDLLDLLSSLEKNVQRVDQQFKTLQRKVQALSGDLAEGETFRSFLQAYLDREFEARYQTLEQSIIDQLSGTSFTTRGEVATSPRGEVERDRMRENVAPTPATAVPRSTPLRRTPERHNAGGRKDPAELPTWTAVELFKENWSDPQEGRLVSKARMILAHNVPDTNVRRDVEQRKELTMLPKKILYEGVWRTGAFNAAQRRSFFLLYSGQSWFKPCALCLLNGHEHEEIPAGSEVE